MMISPFFRQKQSPLTEQQSYKTYAYQFTRVCQLKQSIPFITNPWGNQFFVRFIELCLLDVACSSQRGLLFQDDLIYFCWGFQIYFVLFTIAQLQRDLSIRLELILKLSITVLLKYYLFQSDFIYLCNLQKLLSIVLFLESDFVNIAIYINFQVIKKQQKMNQNTKIDLSQPQKYQLASIVTKNSRTGITSNKRLLAIRKGYLYYYSNVPKKFKGDSTILQTIHELPKCSIQMVNIKQIKGYENNSSYFSIQFQAKNMLERQDIRKTMTLQEYNFSPKNTKENIVWQFTCDNHFVKQKWVAALEGLHNYYTKEKKDIQKFFNDHNSQMKSSSSGGRNSSIPWRESQSFNKKNQVNYLQLANNNQQKTNNNTNKQILDKNLLTVNNSSRIRLISTGNQQNDKSNKFTKQYSPQSSSISKTDESNQQYEIKNKLTEIKATSPMNDQQKNKSSLQQSKTKKVFIKETQQLSGKISPIKPILIQSDKKTIEIDSSDIQDDAKQFEMQIIQNEKQTKPIKQSPVQKKQYNFLQTDKLQSIQISKNSQQSLKVFNELQYKQSIIVMQDHLNLEHKTLQYDHSTYYGIQEALFDKVRPFKQRIQIQQNFIRIMDQFKQKAVKNFIIYVDNLSCAQQQRHVNTGIQIVQKTSNYTRLLLSSEIQYKILTITCQQLIINGKEALFYDEQPIKNLKRQFKVYDSLNKNLIFASIKNQSRINLRLPLCLLIQYKGVVALTYDRRENEIKLNFTSITQREQYKKQLQYITEHGYNLKHFDFCKTSTNQYLIMHLKDDLLSHRSKEQIKKQYLKQILKISTDPKTQSIQFNPPFTQQLLIASKRSNASTSLQSLELYISSLQKIQQFQGICPKEQIIQVLQYCRFCKMLRKVYRSAQAEIHQTDFLNLILKKDTEMTKLLQKSRCGKLPKINLNFFTFLRYYLGVQCKVNQKAIKQFQNVNSPSTKNLNKQLNGPILSTQVLAIVRTFNMQALQISELEKGLIKQISEKNHCMAQKSLFMLSELYKESQDDKMALIQRNPTLVNQVSYLFFEAQVSQLQKDYIRTLQLLKKCELLYKSNGMESHLFFVYLLIIKCYVHVAPNQVYTLVTKTIQFIDSYYGPKSSTMASFLSISAYYLQQIINLNQSILNSNLNQRTIPNRSQTILNHKQSQQQKKYFFNISSKFLDTSANIVQKLYGQTSTQYIQAILDISKLYQQNDHQKRDFYQKKAKQIIFYTNNKQKIIDLEFADLKRSLKQQNFNRCFELINSLDTRLQSKELINQTKIIQFYRILFQLGIKSKNLRYTQNYIQTLWSRNSEYLKNQKLKYESIIMIYKLLKKQQNLLHQNINQTNQTFNSFMDITISQNDNKSIVLEGNILSFNSSLQLMIQQYQKSQFDSVLEWVKQICRSQNQATQNQMIILRFLHRYGKLNAI